MEKLNAVAGDIRKEILHMHMKARSAHIGSALSAVDILVALYFKTLNIDPEDPSWPDRDRFILSKGHAASALYACLVKRGVLPEKYLDGYCTDGGKLCGHTDAVGLPGIEASTGSLGHGLPIGCGMALAARNDKKKYRVFVLLGDGECNEGSVWESAMFAAHYKLENLIAVVDRNRLQGMGRTEDVIRLEPFLEKWKSFGWGTAEVPGHDIKKLAAAFNKAPFKKGRPSVIIADTIKGKGVSFMEDRLEWHYKSPTEAQLKAALKEMGGEK